MRKIFLRALRSRASARRGVLSGLLFASVFCTGAWAQSGRRVRGGEQTGATPSPAPVIELKKPEPTTPKRNLPNVTIFIAGHIEKTSDRAETIFNAFAARLAQSMQTNSLGLIKHDAAEKRARAETENYVVWLEIDRDSYQQGRVIFNSLDYIVRYSILAPQTAEVKAKGKVYYQGQGGARTRQDESTIVKLTPEDAGQAAADMVLDWLAFIAGRSK